MNTIVRIIIDDRVEPGKLLVGGARVVTPKHDADLGRELRTTEIRVHDENTARALRVDLSLHSSLTVE